MAPPSPSPPSPPPPLSRLLVRPLQARDLEPLRALHAALFPLDYDLDFYVKASTGADRIYSYAAFEENEDQEQDDDGEDDGVVPRTRRRRSSRERLVAFVTARLVRLHECEPQDRRALGLASPAFDSELASYVLTLGVSSRGPWRRAGLARALVRMCCAHAAAARCRAAFLHVASYNGAALGLYNSLGFEPLARLAGFYTIATGRQPDPAVTSYDALLYALPLLPPPLLPGVGDGRRRQPEANGEDEAARLAHLALQGGCRVMGAVAPSPFAPGWGAERRRRRGGGGGAGGSAWWWWPPSWVWGQGAAGRHDAAAAAAPPPPPPQQQHASVASTERHQQQDDDRSGQEDDGEVSSFAAAGGAANRANSSLLSLRRLQGACAPPPGAIVGPPPERQQSPPARSPPPPPPPPPLVAPLPPLASRDDARQSEKEEEQGAPAAPPVPPTPPSRARADAPSPEGVEEQRQQQRRRRSGGGGGGGVLKWLFGSRAR